MTEISIIIPTFNSAKTLAVCLDSILKQSFTDFEVLIMDGLSTDNTLEIAKSYDDVRLIISSEKDNGIYDAMNKGITQSKGEWIYFLGSDDRLFNKNVLREVYEIQKKGNSKIIYGNVLIEGQAGWAKNGQIYDGEFSLSKLIESNICHQAIFYKKEVFDKLGLYNIKYSICADWDLNLRLMGSYQFLYTNTIIAVFHGGNSSAIIKNNFDNTEKWISIYHHFKFGVLNKEFSKFHGDIAILSIYFFKKGNYFHSLLLLFIYNFHKLRILIRI